MIKAVILYLREDIPSKLVSTESSSTEGFFLEMNLRNKKVATLLLL